MLLLKTDTQESAVRHLRLPGIYKKGIFHTPLTPLRWCKHRRFSQRIRRRRRPATSHWPTSVFDTVFLSEGRWLLFRPYARRPRAHTGRDIQPAWSIFAAGK